MPRLQAYVSSRNRSGPVQHSSTLLNTMCLVIAPLQAYLSKAHDEVVKGGHLVAVLGVFQVRGWGHGTLRPWDHGNTV